MMRPGAVQKKGVEAGRVLVVDLADDLEECVEELYAIMVVGMNYAGQFAHPLRRMEEVRSENSVAAGILEEGRTVVADIADLMRTAVGLECIEELVVSIRVVGGKAVGKLPLTVHMVLVKMSHNSHLVNYHMELEGVQMANRSGSSLLATCGTTLMTEFRLTNAPGLWASAGL
jgi:hypothetical protein